MKKAIVRSDVKKFRDEFLKGIQGIVRASEIYVKSIDENPRNGDVFRKELGDWIPAAAWSQFEAVGRKWMHPKLLMGGMADRKKSTIVKRLPYSMQERVFSKERFELLTKDGDTLKIDVTEGTAEQAAQLFDGNTLRNIPAQKAYIENQAPVKIQAEVLPYIISGGKITFRRGTILNKVELRRLLQEL